MICIALQFLLDAVLDGRLTHAACPFDLVDTGCIWRCWHCFLSGIWPACQHCHILVGSLSISFTDEYCTHCLAKPKKTQATQREPSFTERNRFPASCHVKPFLPSYRKNSWRVPPEGISIWVAEGLNLLLATTRSIGLLRSMCLVMKRNEMKFLASRRGGLRPLATRIQYSGEGPTTI